MKDDSENHSKDQQFLMVQRLNIIQSVTWNVPRICLIADLEDLENMDASEIYLRRIYAKEVFISQKRR